MDYPEIPGYTILGRLGEGGMATVYLARQEKFNRQVALKVMALHLAPDPSFGERFQREAHIVAQMSHRNFVPVFDVGQHDDFHYMSMEYLPNGDLKSLMAEGLALNDGLHIAREIASGLHYAASKNFVHRDIKPENILFREDHSAVIADFGIARQMDSDTQMTVIGTVVGTAYYMSPEQARAETIDGRSDLYNLGVIIYEMLTGEVPYDADSALAVSIKHVSEDIPLLPAHLEAFQAFIDKALAKNPEDRFQTGEEMIEALDELEELEFDLIEKISTKVVRRKPATAAPSLQEPTLVDASDSATALASDSATVLAPQSGMHAKRASGISSATGRRRRLHGRTGQRSRRRTGQHKSRSKSRWALYLLPVMAVAGAGYWFVTHPRSDDSPAFVKTLDSLFDRKADRGAPAGGTVSDKSRELNRQAQEAIEDDRLYKPAENNAQYFLTTLLALYPEDSQAREGILALYQTYLERAGQAIESGNFEQASEVLNQSSQISYYVESEDDLEQQAKLRNQLIVAQQQDIIAREREADIGSLLAQASELLAAGKLTTPPDGNAYDTYQKVLSLDPANAQATDGIRDIAGGFLDKARGQAEDGDYTLARASMAAAAQIFPRHPEMEAVRDQVQALEQDSLAAIPDPSAAPIDDGMTEAPVTTADPVAAQQADIEALLAAAEEDIVAYRLSSPSDDNALQKYRDILELDPTSEPALLGIEAVAVRYVQMAQTATADARLDEAARYLEQAGKLSPTNEAYIKAQSALIAAQETASTDSAAESEIDEQVTALLEQAQRDIFDNRLYAPGDNNAMLKLRQVLELDPENEDALQQQAELLQRIFDDASADIQAGELEQAQQAIDYLAGNNSDDERLSPLREELAGVSVVDTSALLNEARMLGGPRGVDSGSYRALASLYLQVLAAEPGNTEAQEGLELATRYAVDITDNSIQQGQFAIAQSQIGYLEEIDPEHPQLQELRAAIGADSPEQPATSTTEQGWTDSGSTPDQYSSEQGSDNQELLSSIDGLLQQSHPEAQQSLKDAYQQIGAARALDIANPGVESSLEQLAARYAEVIQKLLDMGDQQAALAYLEDSQSMDLPEGGELGRLRASFPQQAVPQSAEPGAIEDLF